jgi:hypothetical protein
MTEEAMDEGHSHILALKKDLIPILLPKQYITLLAVEGQGQ